MAGAAATRAAAAASAAAVKELAAELAAITTRPWTLMEVCGGQTHAIVRWGLDQLLPPGLRLIHGPGCPVCVTPAATIDQALALARRPEVLLCSYGDMLRVPGSRPGDDLLGVRAGGGAVQLLTSPLQALALARDHPDRQVVFLAVGFETTAPATALLARQALALDLANLSLLVAHVRVAPAMEALLADPGNRVQGFLAAGHVCAVLGTGELEALVARRRVPVVVSGFAPLELMRGLLACVRQLESGAARVENAYGAVVRQQGNLDARALLSEVFVAADRAWRGLGVIAGGGLELRQAYRPLDACRRFCLDTGSPHRAAGPARETGCPPCEGFGAAPPDPARSIREGSGDHGGPAPPAPPGAAHGWNAPDRMPMTDTVPQAAMADPVPHHAPPQAAVRGKGPPSPQDDEATEAMTCIAGEVLRGRVRPDQCPAFATACRPEHPLGAPMVSGEGACAAYFLYRRGGDDTAAAATGHGSAAAGAAAAGVAHGPSALAAAAGRPGP